MIIPGFIISLLTFPGVIVHELAHQLVCWLLRIPVFEVCYFRLRVRGSVGFVRHGIPPTGWGSLLVGLGPLLINSIVGVVIAFPAAIDWMLGVLHGWDIVIAWLGVSIAMHSFPSTGDAASIWRAVNGPRNSFLEKMVAVPLVALIWIGAIGSIFWLDAIYGFLIALILPGMIVHALAAL
jgi:hypothetical protein